MLITSGTAGAIALAGCTSEGGSSGTDGTVGTTTETLSGDITITGSSTVFPLAEAIAETFQNDHPNVNIDISSTGTTLRMNRLAVIDEVLSSSVRLFAGTAADDPKVEQVATALESVLAAEGRRYLMMNVPEDDLEGVKEVIPGMGGPTVMEVAGEDQLAVHAVVDQDRVFEAIADLKSVGASDVLVTKIERLVK